MAVAWIAYLDLDEVREWFAPFREACSHWIWRRWRLGFDGPVYEGWTLENRSPPTLALLSLGALWDDRDDDRKLHMSIEQAREALWIALREGLFAASGIALDTGRRVQIPALEWHELVPVQGHGEIDEVRFGLLGTGYRDVLFPSIALRGFWHPPKVIRLELPDLMPPTGNGYMPLFCAAQWIATEGGKRNFDPADVEVWRVAFEALVAAIASEKVRTIGVKAGQPEPVPSHLFAGILIDYPYADSSLDLVLSGDLVLRSYPYVDDESWRKGFDDALVDRARDHWKRLNVEKGDLRSLWPFERAGDVLADPRTGLPGRPSKAKHLIEDEFQRKAQAGELANTLTEEAEALLVWLATAHPALSRPTRTTVENNMRADYRRLKPTK